MLCVWIVFAWFRLRPGSPHSHHYRLRGCGSFFRICDASLTRSEAAPTACRPCSEGCEQNCLLAGEATNLVSLRQNVISHVMQRIFRRCRFVVDRVARFSQRVLCFALSDTVRLGSRSTARATNLGAVNRLCRIPSCVRKSCVNRE